MSHDFFTSLILMSYSQGSEQSNNPAIHSIQSLLLLVMPKSVKFSAWVWRRCLRWMSERFVCTSACVSVCGPCACVRVCAAGSVRVRQPKCEGMCVFARVSENRQFVLNTSWKKAFLFLLRNSLFLFSSVSDLLRSTRSQKIQLLLIFVNFCFSSRDSNKQK